MKRLVTSLAFILTACGASIERMPDPTVAALKQRVAELEKWNNELATGANKEANGQPAPVGEAGVATANSPSAVAPGWAPPCDPNGDAMTAWGPVNETKVYLDGWTPWRSSGMAGPIMISTDSVWAISIVVNGRQAHMYRGQAPDELPVREGFGCRMPVIRPGAHTAYYLPDELDVQELEITCWRYIRGQLSSQGRTFVRRFNPSGGGGVPAGPIIFTDYQCNGGA